MSSKNKALKRKLDDHANDAATPSKKRRLESNATMQVLDARPSSNMDYLPVTSFDGERVYVTFLDNEPVAHVQLAQETSTKKSLLAIPVEQLLDMIEQEKKEARLNQMNKAQTIPKQASNTVDNPDDAQLFVNKYSPNNFTELLTNEKFNREVLKWVLQYKKPVEKEDKFHPNYKILMLAGPPGIGKTTLAHLIAKHAKYKPIEVNASDERSAKDISSVLHDLGTLDIASFAKGNMEQYKEGKLLILDEIDGIAGKEAKSYIETLLNAAYPKKSNKTDKKGGKKKNQLVLQNPIICICNDQYAPALRDLRLRSKLFVFHKQYSGYDKVIDRLKQICKAENLQVPNRTLSDLVSRYDGDIRACLNTLQFLKKHISNNKDLSELVAEKDVKKDFFEACTQVFQKEEKKKDDNQTESSIASAMSTEAGYERLIDGCFENYPNVRYLDNNLKNTVACLDMLCMSDELNKTVKRTQQYSLLSYMSLPVQSFSLHCSSIYKPKLVYPKSGYELRQAKSQHENIIKSFAQGIQVQSSSVFACKYTQLEVLPHFVDIVAPNIRMVSTQLYSAQEKKEMQNLVDLHDEYGITYKNVYEEGKSQLKMDPDLPSLLCFDKLKPKELSEHQKKIVMGELAAHKIMKKVQKDTAAMKQDTFKKPKESPRKESTSNSSNTTKQQQQEKVPLYIHFKFAEGITNSIRRPAKIKDFF